MRTGTIAADSPIFTGSRSQTEPAADGWLFGRRHTWQVFGLFALLMVFDFADRMIIAALLPSIRLEWHMNDAQAGLLNSVLTLGMILFAFPVAAVIDRWTRVKTASLMGIAWSISSALGGLTANFGQLLITRGLVGLGEAGYAPAAYSWIAAAFPRRRLQLALGLFSAGAPVGMALGVAIGGYIAGHYGWRWAFGVVALPGLLTAALLYRGRDFRNRDMEQMGRALGAEGAQGAEEVLGTLSAGRPPRVARRPRGPQAGSRAGILRTPSLLLSFFMSGMIMMQCVPVYYFLPTYLNRIHGLPLQEASFLSSALMLTPVVGTPLGGWIMDFLTRRRRRAKLVYITAIAALCTALYVIAFHFVASWQVQYGLLLATTFIGSTAVTTPMSMTQELVPLRARALSATCGVIGSALFGSMPGPYLTGLLSDRFGLPFALTVITLASGALTAAAGSLALRFYLRDLARARTESHELRPPMLRQAVDALPP